MPDALLWNLDEAARQLGGISIKTVRRLAKSGAFPLVKVGRRVLIPALAVTNWVNHTPQARPAQENEKCHSTNAVTSGGCASPRQTAENYGKLLALPTIAKPRNTTTPAKRNAGDKSN
ncbi:MAG: DNA-binding protein [Candidatus Competibacteraceae bacterium]|nr:MAG: DNA-binding protein [Candidatus Competibacteraceae bacterium]